jgi:uncharacterized repeat protein (TIGR03847 family)
VSDSIGLNQSARAITVDAVGMPGARTFYFQVEEADGQLYSLLVEKTQAMLLADQIEDFLEGLSQRYPQLPPIAPLNAPALCEPESVMFRAGHFALQYNGEADLIGLEISELRGVDQGTPAVLLVWATRQQMHALADQARRVARSGLASAI